MNQRAHPVNRAFVCSVLFLDIFGYSKKPVTEQLTTKQRLNEALREALRDIPEGDRIVLETSHGAAIAFLNGAEDALCVAQTMREAETSLTRLNDTKASSIEGDYLRYGINLGPVKVSTDDAGQISIAGDGLSVAELIVGFAESGQVLASRAYYEVVSRISEAHQQRFEYLGAPTDQNVREHPVYRVDLSGGKIIRTQARSANMSQTTVSPFETAPLGGSPESLRLRKGVVGMALLLALAMVGSAAWLRGLRVEDSSKAPAMVAGDSTPAPVAPSPGLPNGEGSPTSGTSVQNTPTTVATTPPVVANSVARSPAAEAIASAKVKAATPSVPPKEKVPEGVVTLAIKPWGEVSVDGKSYGISPPLKRLLLAPGPHEITVSNAGFPVFKQQIEAKSGLTTLVEHRFQ